MAQAAVTAARHRITRTYMMRNRYAVFAMAMATATPVAGMDICKARLPAKRIETAIAAAGAETAEAVAAMAGCNESLFDVS